MVCVVILICYISPSILAVGFLVVSTNMLHFATYKNSLRLYYGGLGMAFNFMLLLVCLIKKYFIYYKIEHNFRDRESGNDAIDYLSAWGFIESNLTRDTTSETPEYHFEVQLVHSFWFEI